MNVPAKMSVWSGDMNWPCTLESVDIIECSTLQSVGVWVYEWLRQHPHIALVGASDSIKKVLSAASLPILWYAHCEEITQSDGGVSPSERDMLWS